MIDLQPFNWTWFITQLIDLVSTVVSYWSKTTAIKWTLCDDDDGACVCVRSRWCRHLIWWSRWNISVAHHPMGFSHHYQWHDQLTAYHLQCFYHMMQKPVKPSLISTIQMGQPHHHIRQYEITECNWMKQKLPIWGNSWRLPANTWVFGFLAHHRYCQ